MDNLYAKDQSVKFDTLFAQPTSLYRDTPFWAWNCALTEPELRWQIGIFQEMGMGGFHMHSRTGTVTPYLSDDFMKLVDNCVDEAKKRGMLAWLYDEDRWPSGSAGGTVTEDDRFKMKMLRWECADDVSGFSSDGHTLGIFSADVDPEKRQITQLPSGK